MNVFEEVANELDKGAPLILYRQDLAAILRKMAAAHGEDERTRREALASGPAPLVCSQCGHSEYFKLDIQGRRLR